MIAGNIGVAIMKTKFHLSIFCFSFLLVANPIEAIISEGPSAAAVGLAEAVTGDVINSRAPRYNVGGLGFLRNYEYEVSHVPWIFNTAWEHINAALPTRLGGVGVSALFFHSFFDENNFLFEQGQRKETLNNSDLFLTAGLGRTVRRGLSVGLGANFINHALLDSASQALSLNVGVLYKDDLLAKWLHLPKKKIGFDDEDFRVGFALNEIIGFGEKRPLTAALGITLLPISFAKLNIDTRLEHFPQYYNRFTFASGLELNYAYKFSKVWLRGGFSTSKDTASLSGSQNKVNVGAGVQFSVGDIFYRVDYSLALVDGSIAMEELGRTSWFSLTMGENPVLLKLISAKNPPLMETSYGIKDEILLSSKAEEKELKKVVETRYKVSVGNFTTTEPTVKSKGYENEFKLRLASQLADIPQIELVENGADVVFSGSLKKEGELLQCAVEGKDLLSGNQIARNTYERSITFEREDTKGYQALDVMLKREGDSIVIVPKQKGIEQDKDLVKVDEMAKDASSWIRDNIASIFTSEYLFLLNFQDVDVYVDEQFKGTVGEDKRLKLVLPRGERIVSFLKANTPRKDVKINVVPGKTERMNVNLEEGVFFVDLQIRSAPETVKVMLDKKEVGETPLDLTKIRNGKHTLQYVDKSGKKWTEEINIDKQGTYRLFAMSRFSDSFKDIDANFWNVLAREEGIQVEVNNRRLELKGKSADSDWDPSGLVSRSFKAGKLTLEADMKSKGNNYNLVIAFVDGNGDGVGVSFDRKYIQCYETGRGARKLVPGLDLKDKGTDHKLKIVYEENGTTDIFIDELNLSQRVRKLDPKLRIVILADGEKPGDNVDAYLRNLNIRNELR